MNELIIIFITLNAASAIGNLKYLNKPDKANIITGIANIIIALSLTVILIERLI